MSMKENVAPPGSLPCGRAQKKNEEERTGGFARTSTTPVSAGEASEASTREMFTMAFSPPRRQNRERGTRRRVTFVKQEAAEERDGKTLRELRPGTPYRGESDELLAQRQKLKRCASLAESSAQAVSECESPAPWRLLPRRESLTPRDAESRMAAEHLAALRLQTFVHQLRAHRALAKTARLERRGGREGNDERERVLDQRLAEAAAEHANLAEELRLRLELAEEKAIALELSVEAAREQAEREVRLAREDTAAAGEEKRRADDLERELREARSAHASAHSAWESKRKALHDQVVELRGNVRTFVRVRPPLEGGAAVVQCLEGDQLQVPECVAPGGPPRKPRFFKFAFDRVFGPETEQAAVFEHVLPFVESALDGHAVCVFAYGQTGSGKTYTTLGSPESPGILGNALDVFFDHASCLRIEMLEIYLDKIYDLLAADGTKPLDILAAPGQTCVVKGLVSRAVESRAKAADVLAHAQTKRKVGATLSNDESSRSHCILTLRLPAGGVFNLVDLAGSERLKISQAEQHRLRETQFINTSLAALGNCVAALKHNHNHVPYRDAKLTFLLQPYLGGRNKTLALVTVASEKRHERETLCSLRFAQSVSKVAPATKCPKSVEPLYSRVC